MNFHISFSFEYHRKSFCNLYRLECFRMHPKIFDTVRLSLAIGDGHCNFTVIISHVCMYVCIYIYIYIHTRGGTIRGSSPERRKTFLFLKTSVAALASTRFIFNGYLGFFQGIK